MPNVKLPTYSATSLLKPLPTNQQQDRKVWSIGLNSTWLPFFMAMNVTGQAHIDRAVLGAPLRLATEKDGTPRFNKSGMPVLRVVKELNDQIKITRENFAMHLQMTAEAVQTGYPKEFAAEVKACQAAGKPIIDNDAKTVREYLEQLEQARNAAESILNKTPETADTKEAVLVG